MDKVVILNLFLILVFFGNSAVSSEYTELFKSNLNEEQSDEICSLNLELDLTLENLPKDDWNENTIRALGCIKVKDEQVLSKLVDFLKDGSVFLDLYTKPDVARVAAFSLIKLNPQNDKVSLQIANFLDSLVTEERQNAAYVLSQLVPQTNKAVLSKLYIALKDPDSYVRSQISTGFQSILPRDLEIQLKIAQSILEHEDKVVRAQLLGTFYELSFLEALDEKILFILATAIMHENQSTGSLATRNLKYHIENYGKLSEKVNSKIAEAVSSGRSANSIRNALKVLDPSSLGQKELVSFIEVMKSTEALAANKIALFLEPLDLDSEIVRLKLAEVLTEGSVSELRYGSASQLLKKLSPLSEAVQLKIVEALSDSNETSGIFAYGILLNIEKSEKVLLELVKLLNSTDVVVSLNAEEILKNSRITSELVKSRIIETGYAKILE